jgi:hypothetical protein
VLMPRRRWSGANGFVSLLPNESVVFGMPSIVAALHF